jgi:hypothetical protein
MPRLGNEDGIRETAIEDWCVKGYGSVDEYIGGGGFAWWDFCAGCAAELEGEHIADYLHIVGKKKVVHTEALPDGTYPLNVPLTVTHWLKTFEEPCGVFTDWGNHPDYEGELWKDDDGEIYSDYKCECCDEVLRGSDN